MAAMAMCGKVVFTQGKVLLESDASVHQTIISIFYALKKLDKPIPEKVQQYMNNVFAVPD